MLLESGTALSQQEAWKKLSSAEAPQKNIVELELKTAKGGGCANSRGTKISFLKKSPRKRSGFL